MKGLIKSTHYYSKLAALEDYSIVAQLAYEKNLFIPALPIKAGHGKIDKVTEKILTALGITWDDIAAIRSQQQSA